MDRSAGPGATGAPAIALLTADQLGAILDAAVERALAAHEPPPPRPALLRRADVAAACSVSVRVVDCWRSRGCPVVLIGAEPRYELDAVLAWLRAGGAS